MYIDAALLRRPDVAPEVVRRLALILLGLAAVVARRFLREPKLVALTVPLWGWLRRSARRFERAVSRPAVERERVGAAREARKPAETVKPRVRLPSQRAWLVRALGWEVAAYGSQLSHLLGEPEMQALLAVPAVGRILRPLCRMLGVEAPARVEAVAVVTPEPAPKSERTRKRRRGRLVVSPLSGRALPEFGPWRPVLNSG